MLSRNLGILLIAFQIFEVLMQYSHGGMAAFTSMTTWHTIAFWAPLALGIILVANGISQMRR